MLISLPRQGCPNESRSPEGLQPPAEVSTALKRGVVAWLVSNFSDRDDDNALFSAHLFRAGRLNWGEYVDTDRVEQIQNRLHLRL